MKLSIDRNALHVALAQTARVVARRNTIPILSHVRLDADADGLRLTATDMDVEVSVRAAAAVERPGATTVAAGLLSGLVAKLDGGTVGLEMQPDGVTLLMTAGRLRTRLQTLPAEDFPDIAVFKGADAPSTVRFGLDLDRLAAGIAATDFAISTEETRYYLNGIYWHIGTGDGDATDRLVLVATDGHRLARWRMPAPAGAAGMPGVIVPTKAIGEMARMAREGRKAGADRAAFVVTGQKIRCEIGATMLTAKLIDGTFPDYARVIPTAQTIRATVAAADFAAALDRVRSVMTRDHAARLTFEPATLTIAASNPDAGDAREEIDAAADAALTIGFNAKYAADAVAAIGVETLALHLKDAGSPTIFTAEDCADPFHDADHLVVVMPMRV